MNFISFFDGDPPENSSGGFFSNMGRRRTDNVKDFVTKKGIKLDKNRPIEVPWVEIVENDRWTAIRL